MNNSVNSGLSLDYSLAPTNQDLDIIFTPDSNIVSFKYRIFKNSSDNLIIDGELDNPNIIYNDYVLVNSNKPVNIILSETGNYKLEIITTDSLGNNRVINSGIYVIDKEAPKITISDYNNQTIEYRKGEDTINPLDGVTVYDNYDGDLLESLVTNYDELDFNKTGIKELKYTVSDTSGNVATKIININVTDSNIGIIRIWQILIVLCLLPFLIYLTIYNRAVKLEKRITKYSVEPLKKYTYSMFDKFLSIYLKMIEYIKPIVSKSVFITKHSKKFDKYVGIVDNIHKDSMELICSKIIVSVVVLILAIFAKTIQFKTLALEEVFIPIILGYLLLDIYYILKYKQYRRRLENDLLQAIIVMNNSFKSGRSITQAIEIVTRELDGPIADEFKLMHLQLQFGLSLDVAFAKFASRINIEEVNYLTASLTILNRTGGNIIKVFSSIERTLFNKKKLKLELRSLTGSSRIIMYLLTFLPVFLVIIISLVNPDYFISLYTTPIGMIILGFALIIYISYIVVVRRVMKIRMWLNEKK